MPRTKSQTVYTRLHTHRCVISRASHFQQSQGRAVCSASSLFLQQQIPATNQMVQTRSQERGAPLKKPRAYNTDAYYDELDQGYGDVGVDQEPDAGRTQADNPNDPDFGVSKEEMAAADKAAAEDVGVDVPLKEDVADLKAGPAEDVPTTDKDGGPVGIVPTSREEMEEQEAFTAAGVEEGVSTIPHNRA